MNKSDLIEKVALQANTTKKQAELTVNLIFDSMVDALARGDRIEIRGFGCLISRDYQAYEGRNPRTGKAIHIPEKHLPFFKVGKELKNRVDGNSAAVEETNDSGHA